MFYKPEFYIVDFLCVTFDIVDGVQIRESEDSEDSVVAAGRQKFSVETDPARFLVRFWHAGKKGVKYQ